VQLLLDRLAIQDCVTGYARGLDRHDRELLASAYHEDAIDHHGDFTGPVDEFVAWANAGHEGSYTAHTHFITNTRAEIDGDVAHAESYVLFVLKRKDGDGVDIGGGRYIDRLERRTGDWRIAARELLVEWLCQAEPGNPLVDIAGYPSGTWDHTDRSYRRPLELTLPGS
jgi:hypothetical protein